jgi:16S rRNA (cytosine1402-N4)-methyltransferase
VTEQHLPVLLDRVLELLRPALAGRPAVAVDATVGLAGHASALLAEHPGLRLLALDRDPAAVRLARERLSAFGARAEVVHTPYDALAGVLADRDIEAVDAVLFDLGVSSMQLDTDDRGFAYSRDTPLDMRMDPTSGPTAADVLNGYDAAALSRVFRRYGEERFADRIARRIVAARESGPLTTTGQVADLVRDAIPAAARRTGGHPAKRVFQALRIEVNDELERVRTGVTAGIDALSTDGRIVVLAYHSLEDRIVKRELGARSRSTAPVGLPIRADESQPELELLTRGAEQASIAETATNPRARSVRLRAARRLRRAA